MNFYFLFLKLGFTPCKAKQPLLDMELQENEEEKDEKDIAGFFYA